MIMANHSVLRKRNLNFLKTASPQIFERVMSFNPISKLVFDSSREPDIVVNGQSRYGGRAREYAVDQLSSFWKNPYRFLLMEPKPYPVPGQFFDVATNSFLKKLLDRAKDDEIEFLDKPRTKESFFLLIFGVGFGMHIDELVDVTNCRHLILAEPDFEVFFHSLDVYDWQSLAERVHQKGCAISFIFEDDPITLWGSIKSILRFVNPCSGDGYTYFVHDDTKIVATTVGIIKEELFTVFAELGHFDDQAIMLKNAYLNLRSGKEKNYRKRDSQFLEIPAFIIGSGPSLDDAIPYIRENAENAIIFSSGSAIRPLVLNGIIPDFQVESENINVLPIISQVTDEYDISRICLVAATSVDPSILKYFNNIIYYFRPFLTPFPLFCDTHENCLENPDPTVVNASLSFAQSIGFRDIYLFGVDMGTKEAGDHHSKDSYHYMPGAIVVTEHRVFNIPVPGNFGGTLLTSKGFFTARLNLIEAIEKNKHQCRHYNCSDGVSIDGAAPLRRETIQLQDLSTRKEEILDKLIKEFPIFSKDRFNDSWDSERMILSVNKLADRLINEFGPASSFRDKEYVSRMMNVLKPNTTLETILSDRMENTVLLLFQGTAFMMLIVFEYYINRVRESAKVEAFARIGVEEFKALVNQLRSSAVKLIGDPINTEIIIGSTDAGPADVSNDMTRIPRNAQCPCGSGKKFKHCHGIVS